MRTSDSTGNLQNSYSYHPFGARQQSQTYNTNGSISPVTGIPTDRRGFTGHEMLDELGLVHMNGRVYDPIVGRFLSPDPTIQFPEDMQSYNRYSYVRNNPLSVTDPTGYEIENFQAESGQSYMSWQPYQQWARTNRVFLTNVSSGCLARGIFCANITIGNEAHKLYQNWLMGLEIRQEPDGKKDRYDAETYNIGPFRFGGGRADIVDLQMRSVYEIKPYTFSGMATGRKQLARYVSFGNTGMNGGVGAGPIRMGDFSLPMPMGGGLCMASLALMNIPIKAVA